MSAEGDSPFGILPVELKWKIFGFLNNSDKKKSRLVCPHWRTIIDENLNCRALLTDETHPLILNCHHRLLKSLSIQNSTKIISKYCLQNTLPQINEWTIGRGNSSKTILNILEFHSNQIDSLRIQDMSLSNLKPESLSKVLRNAKWSNLSSLSVTIGSRSIVVLQKNEMSSDCHVRSVIEIFKTLKIPTLKTLTINLVGFNFVRDWKPVSNFVLNHRKSLQELGLVLFEKSAPPPLPNRNKFSEFKNLNLKKFRIKFDGHHASYAQDLCLTIKGLDQLEIFGDPDGWWIYYDSRNWKEKFKLDEIVALHKETLKTFRCVFVTFDLCWLKGFDSLKILELNVDRYYYAMTPSHSLFGLRKFTVLARWESYSNDIFHCMVNRMPNLEEVEIAEFNLRVSHVEILKKLSGIQNLIVGGRDSPYSTGVDKHNSYLLKEFCRLTPGLSFRIEPKMNNRNNDKFLYWGMRRVIIQFNQDTII